MLPDERYDSLNSPEQTYPSAQQQGEALAGSLDPALQDHPVPEQNLEPEPGSEDRFQERKPQAQSFLTRKMAALVLGVTIIASSALGFGGGLLAGNLSNSGPTKGTEILYQSVGSVAASGSASKEALSVADIAGLAANSVVEIATETVTQTRRSGQYIAEGAGSGVIITQDGYIVTNNHVIADANKITVRLRNGQSYTATLVGTDSQTDLAVLKIKASGLQPAVFGDSDALKVGELAVAIGNPLGELGGTVTDGIISALDREIELGGETFNLLQTNAAINPGNSGGGLFNGNGELIGIVTAKSSGTNIEGLGFAIPINDAKPVIEQLMTGGYVKGRISLGLNLVDITDATTAMLYRVRQLGVYVQKVNEGSAAQAAGFKAGDCIVSIDGASLASSADLKKILNNHKVGDTVTFTVKRNGQTLSLSVKLAEYTPN